MDVNNNKNSEIKNEKLAKLHSHPRDTCITFEEGPHIYTITVDGKSDSTYMSVTTFNHSHFKDFNADEVIGKMMKGKKWTESKYYGMSVKEIKDKWKKDGKDAREAGTKMHFDIECFYNDHDIKNDSDEFSFFLKYHDYTKNINPYRTEWMIWDEDVKLAGSIDMVYENDDGTLILCDWKRCKEIKLDNKFDNAETDCISYLPNSNFWHYSLQLNTYKAILERKYNKKIIGLFLVSLHPDNKNFQVFEVGDLQMEINQLFELRKTQL